MPRPYKLHIGSALLVGSICAALFVGASSRAACVNPTVIPTGFAAPCPVFSVSPTSVSQTGTETLSATPQAGTDYIYTTAYYAQGSTWLPVTLIGNNAAPSYSSGVANGNLSASILQTLTPGTNYVVLWDWLWDATAQCYKGPGLNQCNTGTWRVQIFTIQNSYTYSQSTYYAYSQSAYYVYSQSAYVSPTPTPSPISGGGQTLCGLANDGGVHIPSDYNTLTPGAAGSTYTDSSYGCKVIRVTDGKSYCNSSSQHLYAFPTPINLDDTMIIDQLQPPGCGPNAPRYIVSNKGVVVVPAANFPSTASTPDISWDQDDPLTFYYTSGLALYKGVVNKAAGTVASTNICDFTGTYTTLGIPDEENISYDNDHFWLVGNGNLSTGQAVLVTLTPASPSPHTGCIKGATVNIGAQTAQAIPGWHKIQISPLNELMNLNTGTQKTDIWKTNGTLLRTDSNTSHFDVGYDSDGTTEVMIGHMYAGTSSNLCASRNGFAVERIGDGTVLRCLFDDGGHENVSHVSYRDTRSATPWVLMSMERTIPGCSSTDETGTDMSCINGNSNWFPYSGEEIACKVDASVCMRLLHHYSRSSVDAYWATARGAISIDGTSVVFDSNFNDFNGGHTTASGWNYVDTYMTTFR